jgi:hypothetical protein
MFRNRILVMISAGTLVSAVCRHLEASPRPRVVLVPIDPPPRLGDSDIEKAIKQITFSIRKTTSAVDSFAVIAASLQTAYVSRARPNQPFTLHSSAGRAVAVDAVPCRLFQTIKRECA